jgi:hypothetical protein
MWKSKSPGVDTAVSEEEVSVAKMMRRQNPHVWLPSQPGTGEAPKAWVDP